MGKKTRIIRADTPQSHWPMSLEQCVAVLSAPAMVHGAKKARTILRHCLVGAWRIATSTRNTVRSHHKFINKVRLEKHSQKYDQSEHFRVSQESGNIMWLGFGKKTFSESQVPVPEIKGDSPPKQRIVLLGYRTCSWIKIRFIGQCATRLPRRVPVE